MRWHYKRPNIVLLRFALPLMEHKLDLPQFRQKLNVPTNICVLYRLLEKLDQIFMNDTLKSKFKTGDHNMVICPVNRVANYFLFPNHRKIPNNCLFSF